MEICFLRKENNNWKIKERFKTLVYNINTQCDTIFSPTDKYQIVTLGNPSFFIQFNTANKGRNVYKLDYSYYTYCGSFTTDGTKIITGHCAKKIIIWDTKTLEILKIIETDKSPRHIYLLDYENEILSTNLYTIISLTNQNYLTDKQYNFKYQNQPKIVTYFTTDHNDSLFPITSYNKYSKTLYVNEKEDDIEIWKSTYPFTKKEKILSKNDLNYTSQIPAVTRLKYQLDWKKARLLFISFKKKTNYCVLSCLPFDMIKILIKMSCYTLPIHRSILLNNDNN